MLWREKRNKPKDLVERLRSDARESFKQAGYDRLFEPIAGDVLPPNFLDLKLLRDAVLEAKPSLILEHGSGYSTYVFAKTLQSLGKGRVVSVELGNEWRKTSQGHLSPDLAACVEFIAPQPVIRLALLHLPGANASLWFEKKSKVPRRVGVATISFPDVYNLVPDFVFIAARQTPDYVDSVTAEVVPAIVSDPLVFQRNWSPTICADGRREQCAILSANLPQDSRQSCTRNSGLRFSILPERNPNPLPGRGSHARFADLSSRRVRPISDRTASRTRFPAHPSSLPTQ